MPYRPLNYRIGDLLLLRLSKQLTRGILPSFRSRFVDIYFHYDWIAVYYHQHTSAYIFASGFRLRQDLIDVVFRGNG